jgi:hypothetical protein
MSVKRTREEKLLNPKPGSRIAAARDYGIDLSQIVENLRLTPAERIKRNDEAANSVLKFQEAMQRAKSKTEPKTK